MGKRKVERSPAFTQMIHQVLDTPAFKSLTPLAQCIYFKLKRKAGYNGDRNGEVFYSCRDAAAEYHCHQDTARKAFDLLQARGFIKPTQIGSLGCQGQGRATTWRLTELGTPENRRPTKDFLEWGPGRDFQVVRGKSPPNKKRKPALIDRAARPTQQGDGGKPAPMFRAACPTQQGEETSFGAEPALTGRASKESTIGGVN